MRAPRPLPEALDPDVAERFWHHVQKTDGCWLWTGGKQSAGYGVFHPGAKRSCSAHRFSFVLANGEPPADKPLVLHRCDNPPCVRPRDLYAGTFSDNTNDALSRGRLVPVRGEDNALAVLTDAIVLEMVAMHGRGYGYDRIAKHFGVSKGTAQVVMTGRRWSHVSGITPGTNHDDRRRGARTSVEQLGPLPTSYGKIDRDVHPQLFSMREAGFTERVMARWFGISRDHVHDILRAKRSR